MAGHHKSVQCKSGSANFPFRRIKEPAPLACSKYVRTCSNISVGEAYCTDNVAPRQLLHFFPPASSLLVKEAADRQLTVLCVPRTAYFLALVLHAASRPVEGLSSLLTDVKRSTSQELSQAEAVRLVAKRLKVSLPKADAWRLLNDVDLDTNADAEAEILFAVEPAQHKVNRGILKDLLTKVMPSGVHLLTTFPHRLTTALLATVTAKMAAALVSGMVVSGCSSVAEAFWLAAKSSRVIPRALIDVEEGKDSSMLQALTAIFGMTRSLRTLMSSCLVALFLPVIVNVVSFSLHVSESVALKRRMNTAAAVSAVLQETLHADAFRPLPSAFRSAVTAIASRQLHAMKFSLGLSSVGEGGAEGRPHSRLLRSFRSLCAASTLSEFVKRLAVTVDAVSKGLFGLQGYITTVWNLVSSFSNLVDDVYKKALKASSSEFLMRRAMTLSAREVDTAAIARAGQVANADLRELLAKQLGHKKPSLESISCEYSDMVQQVGRVAEHALELQSEALLKSALLQKPRFDKTREYKKRHDGVLRALAHADSLALDQIPRYSDVTKIARTLDTFLFD